MCFLPKYIIWYSGRRNTTDIDLPILLIISLIEAEAEQLSLEPDMTAVPMSAINYQDWLPQWKSLTQCTSTNIVLVPPEACRVTTPLKVPAWSIYLRTYPHQELVQFFLRGITEGFRIRFNYHNRQLKSAQKNLEGALSHPSIVQEYL